MGLSYAELEGPASQGPTLPGPLTLLHTHNEGADVVCRINHLQYQLTDKRGFD